MFIHRTILSQRYKNECVRGFKLHEVEVRLLAYADDIAILCTDYESITHAVEKVKQYCSAAGSTVNWGKCIGFWHGEWSTNPEIFANIPFVNKPVKYLGAPLHHYKDSGPYWQEQAAELRDRTNNWNGRRW